MTPIVFGEREKEREKHLGSCSLIFNEKNRNESNVLKSMIKDVHCAMGLGRKNVGAESAGEKEGRSRRGLRTGEAWALW